MDNSTHVSTFGVAPTEADWYYHAIVSFTDDNGTETREVDGYGVGKIPSLQVLQSRIGDATILSLEVWDGGTCHQVV